jgi:GcrA cell cycle regulator
MSDVILARTSSIKWTLAISEEMRALWRGGDTATQIAEAISHKYAYVTRNAVIGKLSRLGESEKTRNIQPVQKEPGKPRYVPRDRKPKLRPLSFGKGSINPEAIAPTSENLDANLFLPESRPMTLMELTKYACRWPCGTPGESTFRFCGADAMDEKSYCFTHFKLSRVPFPPKKIDRRPFYAEAL